MLIGRVAGSASVAEVRAMFDDAELLMEQLRPETANFATTAGEASIAADELPSWRFGSRPQPHLMSADRAGRERSDSCRSPSTRTPLVADAHSNVHGAAFSRRRSAPVVCASRNARSA